MPVFGVSGCPRIPGAQRFEVVELQPESTQVELDVQSQAGVTAGEHETIPPGPLWVGRVVPHHLWNNRYAAGARLIAVPGWPLPTFCTASAASTRMVSTARASSSVQPRG